MKISTILFSFYFLLLIAIPTLKVVKSQFGCEKMCCKERKQDAPKSCQKEKCILNFNSGQFVIEEIQSIPITTKLQLVSKNKIRNQKVFIANYDNMIWQPPEQNV